jgi:hypothetical protein
MPYRHDSSSDAGCSGIACILDAVRTGDDPRIDRVLNRFVRAADLPALFALRAALAGDPFSEHRPESPCRHGA